MTRTLISASLLVLAAACTTEPEVLPFEVVTVPAVVETAPMTGMGDRADDPAVWVNPLDSSRSLILGTNKDEGLHVYNLAGEELQFFPVGRLNNVDVRFNLAVASNDEVNGLSWFDVDPETATVTHLGDTPVTRIEPYGICAGMVDGTYYAAPTYKDGAVELWAVHEDGGTISPELVRTIQLGSQLEGCVFHDGAKTLFIGEEEHGIWKVDLSDPASMPVSVDTIAAGNGLVADVEGLSIWDGGDGVGYLIASAQAADRYVIYDLAAPHAPRAIIHVGPSLDGTIDGVTHTDGLDVSSTPLPGYPQGILVVQDDGNPVSEQDQNFKIVDWREIAHSLVE